MLELLKNKRVMVIAAHPDDELLGLGATINKLIKDFNCTAKAVILGEGITSRTKSNNKNWKHELKIHKGNMNNATKTIGYQEVASYNLPDNSFDSIALLEIVKIIEKEKELFKPDVIFVHHSGDTNIDHKKTFEALIPAVRPMEGETVKTILAYETPSSTEWQNPFHGEIFKPNVFIEISEKNIDVKIEAMSFYEFETRPFPHPRSPESLKTIAKERGIRVGYNYAEAFMLIRSI